MNWYMIDKYMEDHDFLPADRFKIHNFVLKENYALNYSFRYVNGYLTRKSLILIDSKGFKTDIPRSHLGIQVNFC